MAPSAIDAVKAAIPDRSVGDADLNLESNGDSQTCKEDVTKKQSKPYTYFIQSAPVTMERQPYVPRDTDRIVDPGTARANIAATNDAPRGTKYRNWRDEHSHETVLQQHCSYFDKDGDGIIWPFDTYRGCRAWGWNTLLCLIATVIIHSGLSYATCPTYFPDPFFRLWISRMHKNKHGSSTMTYDNEGRFRPQNFEEIFTKYDLDGKGGLNIYDFARLHKGQRLAADFWGWTATALEWTAFYLLIWPADGVVRKEDVRMVFDGSIFQKKADDYAATDVKPRRE